MGLFGSRYKTQVGTQVQRVLDDESLPNSIRTGYVKNLYDPQGGQMHSYIMDEMSNSIALRANRMYKYGKNGYAFGIPTSNLKTSAAAKEATKNAIQAAVGGTVQLSYYHFGPLNNLHLAWKILVESHGYDSVTNKLGTLTSQRGTNVYLSDIRIVVQEATVEELHNGSLEHWGTSPKAGFTPHRTAQNAGIVDQTGFTPFSVSASAPNDYAIVEYTYLDSDEEEVEGVEAVQQEIRKATFTIQLTGFDMASEYHQARYVRSNGKAGYWVYKAGAGQYPAVDTVFNQTYDESGTFFPFGYLRYNKVSESSFKGSDNFKSSKKLFNYLNMDFESVADAINENPDIADVEQAMIMMAVPANTTNKVEQKYLFDFFSSIDLGFKESNPEEYTHKSPMMLDIENQLYGAGSGRSVLIMDKRFKMAIHFAQIAKRRVVGNFGPKGSYGSGFSVSTDANTVPRIGGGTKTWNTETKTHWYRHQHSENVYDEVQVVGLQVTYHIWNEYTATGDELDDILMIPVNVAIADTYTLIEREELYSRGLHYIFNSRVTTKLKWYQTGLFKAIMIIIAIVILVLSWGTQWQALGAALATGTGVGVALINIVIQLLIQIAISKAIQLFVKIVGVKIAFIAAIVAALYGGYAYIDTGSVNGLPWANELVNLSTNLMKAVNAEIAEDFNDLLAERSEFQKYVDEQTKTLDDLNAELRGSNALNPMIIWGETPSEFYQRTVHSGNIGILGYDAIDNYVEVALQLPKINETLGGNLYGNS